MMGRGGAGQVVSELAFYFWGSEFKSHLSLQFFTKFELQKNENQQKEAGVAHLSNKKLPMSGNAYCYG